MGDPGPFWRARRGTVPPELGASPVRAALRRRRGALREAAFTSRPPHAWPGRGAHAGPHQLLLPLSDSVRASALGVRAAGQPECQRGHCGHRPTAARLSASASGRLPVSPADSDRPHGGSESWARAGPECRPESARCANLTFARAGRPVYKASLNGKMRDWSYAPRVSAHELAEYPRAAV